MKRRQKLINMLSLAITTVCTVVCSIVPQGIEANAQSYSVVRDEKIIYRGHTYAFMDAREKGLNTYYAVEEYCRNLGGHLAVIDDYDENDFLFTTLQNSFSKTAFFGYSDQDSESVWVWTGPYSDYENWTRNSRWYMPDNGREYGGDEDYAEFNYERGKDWLPNDGTWNDAPFRDNTDLFICEWEYEDSYDVADPYQALLGMESVISATLYSCEVKDVDGFTPSIDDNDFFWYAMYSYCNTYPIVEYLDGLNLPGYGEGGSYRAIPESILRNAAYAMFPDFNGTFPAIDDDTWCAKMVDHGKYGIINGAQISFARLRSWNLYDDGTMGAVYYLEHGDLSIAGCYQVFMRPNPNYNKDNGQATYYYIIDWIEKME